MKTKITLTFLLGAFSALTAHIACADTQIGVISVSFNAGSSGSGSGSGSYSTYDPCGLYAFSYTEADSIQLTVGGQITCKVMQNSSGLYIDDYPINVNAQQTASGGGTLSYSYTACTYGIDASGPPVFSFLTADSSPALYFGTPNGFYVGQYWELEIEPEVTYTPFSPTDHFGTTGAAAAEILVEDTWINVPLTNLSAPWSYSISTNTSFQLDLFNTYSTSQQSANETLTATISFTPVHFAIGYSATPTNGPASLTVNFTTTNVDSAGITVTNWNWNFGDGASSTNRNSSHTYTNNGTFAVSLVASNINGTQSTGFGPRNIVVGPPVDIFTATPTNGPQPLAVQFTASNMDTATNPITSWAWNFGDTMTSNVQNPLHTYTNQGTYTVTLTVMTAQGMQESGVGSSNITVAPLTAQYYVISTNGYFPLFEQFYGPSLDSAGNPIVSWNWDFGNNSSGTTQNPQVTYLSTSKKQTYQPTLMVTNSLGNGIAATGPKITAIYPPLGFSATPSNGLVPQQVQFTTSNEDQLSVPISRWHWSFGDGATSTNQNPTHIYTNTGFYAVTLTATNVNNTSLVGVGPMVSIGCGITHSFAATNSGIVITGNGSEITNVDGAAPSAGLTTSGGRLYGVASTGGVNGTGEIFAMNTDGSDFTNLYDFTLTVFGPDTNVDGASPSSPLSLYDGTLYGSTASGGTLGGGTVFSIGTNGMGFTDLCDFTNSGDTGYQPNGVILCGGNLYGTAGYGGANNNGTIFEIGAGGFTPIHQFQPTVIDDTTYSLTNGDGANPLGELVLGSDGVTLYGTASEGGTNGYGTVFSIQTSGAGFTVLHHFDYTDGQWPMGELALSGNVLYGTTKYGGSGGLSGTVFKLNTDGTGFRTLYSFSETGYNMQTLLETNGDGSNPEGGLFLTNGVLYGTAEQGGTNGSGTIFAVGTNGGFTNLYTFMPEVENTEIFTQDSLDGAKPHSCPVVSAQTLFVTTMQGGDTGFGTIISVSLAMAPPPLDIQSSPGALTLSWPSFESGWTLQQSTSLTSPNWIPANLEVSDDGTFKSVSVVPGTGNLFFRLKQP